MVHDVGERFHQYELDGESIASRQGRYLREVIYAPTQTDPRKLYALSHAMPNVAQDEIQIAVDGFGTVDQKSQLHENFANAALDVGQAEFIRCKMRQQCCKASPNAVVHISRKVLTLRNSGLHHFDLSSLANLLQASNENGCCNHRCSQYEPAKRKRVEKSDVLRAKVIFVVSDSYVERNCTGSQERSDPGDVVGTPASIKLAVSFTCHNSVVGHCQLGNRRAIADGTAK